MPQGLASQRPQMLTSQKVLGPGSGVLEVRKVGAGHLSCSLCPQGDRGFDGQSGPKGDQGEKGERVS